MKYDPWEPVRIAIVYGGIIGSIIYTIHITIGLWGFLDYLLGAALACFGMVALFWLFWLIGYLYLKIYKRFKQMR